MIDKKIQTDDPSPARRFRPKWAIHGAVVMVIAIGTMIGLTSPALAAGEWNNNQTTMIIRDNGLYVGTVEVAVWTMNKSNVTAQARVWGAGFSGWTKAQTLGKFTTYRGWVTVNRVLPEGSRICAEGFLDGRSHGLPCTTIRR